MRLGRRRPKRALAAGAAIGTDSVWNLGEPVAEATWVEPDPEAKLSLAASEADPAVRYERRASVELAFGTTLQQLPAK